MTGGHDRQPDSRGDGQALGHARPQPADRRPWYQGAATGIGSLPGTDPDASAAMVAGELPELPHIVELPARGPAGDMIGRAAAMLVDIAAEVVPTGWRLTRRPGRDLRRAKDFLARDLDAVGENYAGAPWVKLQVAGPWTLAALVEAPSGNRALTDPGAAADLAASLAEGILAHVREVAARVPGAGVLLQIDEPALPAVLAGTLPTASGFGTVSAVDRTAAGDVLRELVGALAPAPTIVHCCHPDAPVGLLRSAGFAALSLDLIGLPATAAALDPLGEAVEAGVILVAGTVSGSAPPGGGADRVLRDWAAPILRIWDRLGLERSRLADQVVPTPVCGLAGADDAWARRAMALVRDIARLLADEART